MNKKRIIILVLANIPVFIALGKVYFGSFSRFLDCIRYSEQSDFVSAMDGESWKDFRSTWELYFFIGGCVALLVGEYVLIGKLFG
jgi:hypothetical protein